MGSLLVDRVRAAASWHATVSRGLYSVETIRPLDGVSLQPLEEVCSLTWQDEVMNTADDAVRAQGIEPRDFKAVFYYFTLNARSCSFEGNTSGNACC